MSNTYILKEVTQLKLNEEKIKELREADERGEDIILTGVIQRADAKNQNGRIYPEKILKKECDRYLEEYVKKGLAMGELDHTDESIIQLKNVSHVIDDLWWGGPENKETHGKIRLLPTPAGDVAKKLVLAGIPLGISSRAIGSLSTNEAAGEDVVGEDLQIICWDLVGTPSTHNAYLKLHESKKIDLDNFDIRKILPPQMRVEQTLRELLKK